MENLGIASVAAITVITYLMGMAVRASRTTSGSPFSAACWAGCWGW